MRLWGHSRFAQTLTNRASYAQLSGSQAAAFVFGRTSVGERKDSTASEYAPNEHSRCVHEACTLPQFEGPMCYLHLIRDGKRQDLLTEAFEQLDRAGVTLCEDFYLIKADLRSTYLHHKLFRSCNFARASLMGCRMYKVAFDSTFLEDVNFENSLLEKVNFRDAVTLKGIRLFKATLDRVELPDMDGFRAIMGGTMRCVYHTGPPDVRDFVKAFDVYHRLKESYRSTGEQECSAAFYMLEMDMKRKTSTFLDRVFLTVIWLLCGYGERPLRLMFFVLLQIVLFATIYLFVPRLLTATGPVEDWDVLSCLYFSTVVFTTLGFGDIAPQSYARIPAALESFFGSFTIALFVFVFSRQMSR